MSEESPFFSSFQCYFRIQSPSQWWPDRSQLTVVNRNWELSLTVRQQAETVPLWAEIQVYHCLEEAEADAFKIEEIPINRGNVPSFFIRRWFLFIESCHRCTTSRNFSSKCALFLLQVYRLVGASMQVVGLRFDWGQKRLQLPSVHLQVAMDVAIQSHSRLLHCR